jgi:hypothetical protein
MGVHRARAIDSPLLPDRDLPITQGKSLVFSSLYIGQGASPVKRWAVCATGLGRPLPRTGVFGTKAMQRVLTTNDDEPTVLTPTRREADLDE